MDELLTRSVDLIRDRFALYHVQIFIVDEARVFANLAASTGDIGQGLLAQGFQVPLNTHTIISDVIAAKELIYVRNVAAVTYQHPKLLAQTRSEIAVPLLIGDDVFGVLDIHSLRMNAFSNDDIETMRVMANQISQAVQNARLFEAQQRGLLQNRRLFLESETNLREIQRLNRQLTGQAWQDYVLEWDQSQFSVQLNGQDIHLGTVEWTPPMRQAITRHRLVIQKQDNDQLLAIPISIRGQPIGAIEVRLSGDHNQSEVLSILQAVAERVAFSLENARLFEQSQAIVEREQQINMITARLQGLTSVEDVLTTAISSLAQALHAEQGSIRLVGPEEPVAPPQSVGNGQAL
jgi:GAF domain-containing protein